MADTNPRQTQPRRGHLHGTSSNAANKTGRPDGMDASMTQTTKYEGADYYSGKNSGADGTGRTGDYNAKANRGYVESANLPPEPRRANDKIRGA